jgi:hypothetical protein
MTKKRYQGKVHYIHPTAEIDDYPNSPHIIYAIEDKHWSFCTGYMRKVTHNEDEVTCGACLKLINIRKGKL